MLCDPRIAKLARLLVRYSTEIQTGEKVLIVGTTASEPLVREIFREVLDAGAHPSVRLSFEDQDYIFYQHAADHQIDYQDPLPIHEIGHVDALFRLFPDTNPRALSSIDAAKKQRATRARKPFSDLFHKRWGANQLRWVGTCYPTGALAQEAQMSVEEYSEFVFGCGNLNDDDPIAYWRDFSRRQQAICDRLDQSRTIRYVGLDTDIQFGVAGRKWINCDGRINFPDGEVFTSPIEDSVEGKIRFTFPGIFQGEEVEDIRLRFVGGRVVEAQASKGEKLLHALLDTDEGSRYAGEVAIGTNQHINRFTKNMLFDEKLGGTVHVAVGAGFPMSGGKNNSSLHWDMLKDMREGGEIYADDQLIYRDGRFLDLA